LGLGDRINQSEDETRHEERDDGSQSGCDVSHETHVVLCGSRALLNGLIIVMQVTMTSRSVGDIPPLQSKRGVSLLVVIQLDRGCDDTTVGIPGRATSSLE
jgi:hypothetical protein